MAQTVIFSVFVLLGVATVVWLILVSKLFEMLKFRAPEVYASIGLPHVVLNSTPSNNIAFLRYLLGGHYVNVGDVEIRKLCAFLRALFWGYLICFLGLLVAVFAVPSAGI